MQNNSQGTASGGGINGRSGHGRSSGGNTATASVNGQVGPNVKDDSLKHVPCKFYRQGNCTAGDSCVFSHQAANTELCKYYLKGNCKFGNKCALVHGAGGHGRFRRRVNSSIGGGNGTGNSNSNTNSNNNNNNNSNNSNNNTTRTTGNATGSNNHNSRTSQSQPQTPTALLNQQRSLVMQPVDRTNGGNGHGNGHGMVNGHMPRSPGLRSPSQLPLTTTTIHNGMFSAVSAPSPGLGHNTNPLSMFGSGLDLSANNAPLSYDFPMHDAYHLYDTPNTHTGLSDLLGGRTNTIESINIPSRQPSMPTLMPSANNTNNNTNTNNGNNATMSGMRTRPRPLRSATVSLMSGIASNELMSMNNSTLSSSMGGGGGGIGMHQTTSGDMTVPRTPEFATSPFGGERSFLLSLSYETPSNESLISASLQSRRNQLRVANLLSQRNTSSTSNDTSDHLGDDIDLGIDGDDGSELAYDDFQPEFFPSSLDELLTPSELEKRRRREHAKLNDETKHVGLSSLSSGGIPSEMGELQPPISPTKQPLQHHWRSTTLSPLSPFARGIPMSMPNHNSLHDYDRFNSSLQQQQQQQQQQSMSINSMSGTSVTSPGPWTRSDPQQPMGSTHSNSTNTSNISNYIQAGFYHQQHVQNNQQYQHSVNNANNNLMLNSLGDLSLGHVPVSFDMTTKNNGTPLFDTTTTTTTSKTESRFSFHLDDDVPFRMDDVSESSPMPIGLSSQTPSAMTTTTTLSSSSNELNSANVIGSPLMPNELSSRLAGLHLDTNSVQTANSSINPWS